MIWREFAISVMMVKKTIITLQALRLKLNSLNQHCISLKLIMQLTKTIHPDSATFIEEKVGRKSIVAKKNITNLFIKAIQFSAKFKCFVSIRRRHA